MQSGSLTASWGKTIVEQLLYQGVDYFCLAPGFRATPIAIGLAENPNAQCFVHFDERAICFHAIGYAKATKKPAVVVVTSGTAVGNLMPGVMEAWGSCIPLILLTCDRPHELRDTMANQTADQLKIFGDYVRYFFDLPTPSSDISNRFLATTLAQAVNKALYPLAGPVQINCPFPEPFFDQTPTTALQMSPTHYHEPEISLSSSALEKWGRIFNEIEKGVIVLGGNDRGLEIQSLAQKLHWPIFPDILSSYRQLNDPHSISFYHHILKAIGDLQVDMVLHFGDPFVSKSLLQWMGKQSRVIHVANHAKRCDPFHSVTDRIICSPNVFCEQIAKIILEKETNWLRKWEEFSQKIKKSLSFDFLTEPGVAKSLEKFVHPSTAFFLGNSMPIRDVDMFFFPKEPCGPIFANRGLSGIDGNIATCVGIATQMPVIALIGDQTLLHDLTSLFLIKKAKHSIKIILINNGGGGIFSFVSVGEKKDVLDSYFANIHDFSFEKSTEFFDLPYAKIETEEQFFYWMKKKGSCLMEIQTNRQENFLLHEQIDQITKSALCSSFCTVF